MTTKLKNKVISHWIYKKRCLDTIPSIKGAPDSLCEPKPPYGFVYRITSKATKQYYIGQKGFTKAGFIQVKGKKKKCRKESDWKTYTSSSKTLIAMIEDQGDSKFIFEILYFVRSKSEASYVELQEQLKAEVFHDPLSLNGIINIRIHRSHVRDFKDRIEINC